MHLLPKSTQRRPSGASRRTFLGRAMRAAGALAGPLLALPAAAGPPAAPVGKVVLSVVGHVRQPNAGARADFDMAMLDALPQHNFTTETPWFKSPRKFSGPLLRDVLAAAGAEGAQLRAVALNRYKVDIPRADANTFDMLLATRLDDAPMTVRNKGPLFLVYPFGDDATLRSERYYGRSAWQLRSIEVK